MTHLELQEEKMKKALLKEQEPRVLKTKEEKKGASKKMVITIVFDEETQMYVSVSSKYPEITGYGYRIDKALTHFAQELSKIETV